MRGLYVRFMLAWLAAVGVGCTSAPLRYYTLTPPPDRSLPVPEPNFAIDVRNVRTSPQLNRAELIIRTGPTEVTILENERWTSPLNDEIRDALRLELVRRLGMSGLGAAFTKLTADVDVQQLEADLGRYALLQASWSATLSETGPQSTGARTTSGTFRAKEDIHAGYAGMVAGYQQEIAALAGAIVAGLTGATSDIDARCQTSAEGAAPPFCDKNH